MTIYNKTNKIILIICSAMIIVTSIIFVIFIILGTKEHIGYLTVVGHLENEEEQSETSEYILYAQFMSNGQIIKSTAMYDFYVYNNTVADYIIGVQPIPINIGVDGYELISTKDMQIGERIDNIIYSLKLKPSIKALFVLSIIVSLLTIICSNVCNRAFVITVGLISLSCLIFQFCIGTPGQIYQADCMNTLFQALNNTYNNWHPVIIALTYKVFFILFGERLFYIFLINLICWYVGIALLISGLYLKSKNKLVILLFLLTFLQNFFFTNFWHLKDVTFSMYMWLAYNIILFQILHQFKRKWINILLRVITAIVLFLALLWRHNGIVTIYPIFLYFVYIALNRFNIKSSLKYLAIYCAAMLIIAMLLVGIIKVFPLLFMKEDNTRLASRHIEMHRASAIAVLSGDESLIPNNWYAEGKTFTDLKTSFNNNKYSADGLVLFWNYAKRDNVFNLGNITNSRTVFTHAINKYPYEFLQYTIDYTRTFWQIEQGYTDDSSLLMGGGYFSHVVYDFLEAHGWSSETTKLMKKHYNSEFGYDILKAHGFPSTLELSQAQATVMDAIHKITPKLKVSVGIYISIMIFFVSGYLWLFKKKARSPLLLFAFATAFSAFATALIVGIFSPVIDSRYLMPVLPLSVISVASFLISKW